MSLLTRVSSSTTGGVSASVPTTSVITDTSTKSFVIITSKSLTDDEMKSLQLHGSVIQYSATLFQGISDISSLSFNYLLFDVNQSDDLNWIMTNISTIIDYVIVITSDNISDDPWLKTLVDGGYITNILKHLPTGSMVKEIFDQKLINTIYIPHRKSFCEKMTAKITPVMYYWNCYRQEQP